METLETTLRITKFVCLGVLAVLSACTTPSSGVAAGNGLHPDTSAFADALAVPNGKGVPCRLHKPNYSAVDKQMGMAGAVRIVYVVNTVGRVDAAIVDKSSGYSTLDEIARQAMANATCAPYVVNGVAHRVVQNITFRFHPKLRLQPAGNDEAMSTETSAAPVTTVTDTPPPPAPTPLAPMPLAPIARAPIPPALRLDAILAGQMAPQAASSPLAANSPAPPPSMQRAIVAMQDAVMDVMLQKLGLAPDSPQAQAFKRAVKRLQSDPEINDLMRSGVLAKVLNPSARSEIAADGMLRVTPEERSEEFELAAHALDQAPKDCGGYKDLRQVTAHYMPLAHMSGPQIDRFFDISYDILKKTAEHAPMASVTDEQLAQAHAALHKQLIEALRNDSASEHDVLTAAIDPENLTPTAWCNNMRLYQHTILALPQPERDAMIVDGILKEKAKLIAAHPIAASDAMVPTSYPEVVRRWVKPNMHIEGYPNTGKSATIMIHCAPNGTVLSASIVTGSGDASFDTMALNAVTASSPLPPAAGGKTPPLIRITFHENGND